MKYWEHLDIWKEHSTKTYSKENKVYASIQYTILYKVPILSIKGNENIRNKVR